MQTETRRQTELQVTQHVGFVYLLSSKNRSVSYFIEIQLRSGESKLIRNQQITNMIF